MKTDGKKNASGISPLGYRVLVRPDALEERTKGGIVIPATEREKFDRAQQTGVLVAVGTTAWKEYAEPLASVGDRVVFARYGGAHMTGKDGVLYRLLNDEQVVASVDDGVALGELSGRETYAAN
ncbi:MAG: co-chaperone GroES [Acidimicrobiia bacterium]|nr:co-chaperone GroES [Acidimicrobiia bacterium]